MESELANSSEPRPELTDDPHNQLDRAIGAGKSSRWIRIVIQSVAGTISAATGGFVTYGGGCRGRGFGLDGSLVGT